MDDGAVELDMVLNIGRLRSGRDAEVRDDIRAVVEASAGRAIVKVILENAYLTDDEKVRGVRAGRGGGRRTTSRPRPASRPAARRSRTCG